MCPLAITSDGPFPFSPRAHRAREIPWREWGPEAFEEARADGRLVLLGLATSWSPESHRMDEGAYSDSRVIDLVASEFVPVRVDADERPEVATRYGPEGRVTAFLTPDGDPLATVRAGDPAEFIRLATAVLSSWSSGRDDVLQQADAARATRAAERATALAARTPGVLTPAVMDVALDVLDARWSDDDSALADDVAHRRLHPALLRFWRYAYHRRGLATVFNRAFSLASDAAAGALYDEDAGGFYHLDSRGDAGDAGAVPLPAKLARDQGAMLLALAELAASDEEARGELTHAIEGTAAYLISVLGDPRGAVFLAEVASSSEDDVSGLDRRVFTAPAAVAARGLLVAGTLLDRPEWVERGRRIVDFLLAHVRAGEAGMYHVWDGGEPRHLGVLDDQAQMLLALLACYEVSGQPSYFEPARRMVHIVERDWHMPGVGFADVVAGHDETGLLAEPSFPLAVNVDVAEAFLWVGRLTHDERYLEIAQDTLSAFASGLEGRGLAIAGYARVVDRLLSAEPEFKIVAEQPPGEADTVADPLHRAALRLPLAGSTVQRLHRTGDLDLMYQLGLPDVGRVAYVCMGRTCSPPLGEPDQLLPAVEALLEQPAW